MVLKISGEFYIARDVAAMLGTSVSSVGNIAKRNKWRRPVRGLYDARDVNRYIEERQMEAVEKRNIKISTAWYDMLYGKCEHLRGMLDFLGNDLNNWNLGKWVVFEEICENNKGYLRSVE